MKWIRKILINGAEKLAPEDNTINIVTDDPTNYYMTRNLGLQYFTPYEWMDGQELKKGVEAKITGDEHDMIVKDQMCAAAVELNPVDTLVFAGRMKPPLPGSLAALARTLSPPSE